MVKAKCYVSKTGVQLVIPHCPLCGGEHFHGTGGDPDHPLLGHRVPHCLDSELHGEGYELVLEDEKAGDAASRN